MSITRVATNFEALFARQQIQKMEMQSGKAMSRIASGLKINNAGDDPSSISALSQERASMAGARVAQQNLQESTELLKFADSVLAGIENSIIELSTLATRVANDATLSTVQETAIIANYAAITAATGSLGATNLNALEWNGIAVANTGLSSTYLALDGAGNQLQLTNAFAANAWDQGTLGYTAALTVATANTCITTASAALDIVGGYRADIGGILGRLEMNMAQAMSAEVNHASAVSTIGDADLAGEIAQMATSQIIAQSATAMLGQANLQGQIVLSLLG